MDSSEALSPPIVQSKPDSSNNPVNQIGNSNVINKIAVLFMIFSLDSTKITRKRVEKANDRKMHGEILTSRKSRSNYQSSTVSLYPN